MSTGIIENDKVGTISAAEYAIYVGKYVEKA